MCILKVDDGQVETVKKHTLESVYSTLRLSISRNCQSVDCFPKQDEGNDYFQHTPVILERESLCRNIRSIFDYRCMVSAGERIFVIGIGRSHVFQWNGRPANKWTKFDKRCNLRLPGDTLFEAELVEELRGEGSGQRKSYALHMLDAMWLGGEDVRHLHFTER